MYVCKSCGSTQQKWLGKCPQCEEWGTFEEAPDAPKKSRNKLGVNAQFASTFVKAGSYERKPLRRFQTGFEEVDRVLGGGIAEGTVALIGGDPGIGKSTLLLQVLANFAASGMTVAYISGEESIDQVSERLERVVDGVPDGLFLLSDQDLGNIMDGLVAQEFDAIVIDSIHSLQHNDLEGQSGGMSQLKAVTSALTAWAKKSRTVVFLIAQVTKEGYVAGPKTVEHIVDVVMYLEKVGSENTRMIRTLKNRYGDTGEVGFLDMGVTGMGDKTDFATMLVSSLSSDEPGSALGITLQGSRPMIVQIQALVNDSTFAIPRRVVEGVSKNRVEVLAAVIAKKIPKLYLDHKDIFIKVNGGISLKDAGTDLALVAAMISSVTGKPWKETLFIGEVGLLGEVKPGIAFEQRYKEAKKLNFKDILAHKGIPNISKLG
ncbi:DNA repair protein RadA [Candidatus Dojkabacteria bacterium CG_4_9_14_3_um_filter_150_Dojkabacteria_WS6_41_13]|uniref:DNA repair protein RadA n=1 Tax=Candidatus Dojkabacteria bacterium CG_4_10_14_0_2_um_filter_Dojkabacteria_WS6_41_15 TaxID=2014249 RepID=A0A2M7W0M6_9BACT|nr:MAG: DNA repair protein RadA [Candidatus Dojkabacteria bacterium CG_4_10_14_0_2_um_filter_Dojkabacteria_WS6_41_15]PJB23973.1 MAG: DNA repair protein RadA [Candidatus Dojkabacteria bacterium CG_4_9_14_3_um_filter_150_Dojkabacteria_WS6_41_13]